MPRIEFLQEWAIYVPGQVVDYEHAGEADVLVGRRIARLAGGPVQPTTATTTAVGAPLTAVDAKKPRGGAKKPRAAR